MADRVIRWEDQTGAATGANNPEPAKDKVEAIKKILEQVRIVTLVNKTEDDFLTEVSQSIAQLFEAEKAETFREIQTGLRTLLYQKADTNNLVNRYDIEDWWKDIKNKYLGEKK